ncbi:MAG: sodium-dependent transporter [Gammaproteobacteria bacterium]
MSNATTETFSHEAWTSRAAFLMASVGAAVGLGNLWRFPYIAGVNGGGGFVLVYIGFVFLLGLPVMIGEMMIGHRGQQSAVGSMNLLVARRNRSPFWKLIGWLSIVIPLVGLSYYSVVAAWALDYLGLAVSGSLSAFTADNAQLQFELQIGQPFRQCLLHAAFIGMTVVVVARGLNGGIEKISKLMIPGLFAIMLLLVAHNLFRADFGQAFEFLFRPDFSQLDTKAVLMALGQALFSLAIGVGVLMTYSAYLPKQLSLPTSAAIICIGDTSVALLAGLAIFPIVFQYGLSASEGPGLIFVTLPVAFAKMPGGIVVAALFFLLLFFAAFTTAIGMLEPMVSWLEERHGYRRATMAALAGLATWLLGIASVLSFSVWGDVHPLGFVEAMRGMTFFDLVDFAIANMLLPINALLLALFAGWSLDKAVVTEELGVTGGPWLAYWRFAVRYLVPVALALIMIDLWR